MEYDQLGKYVIFFGILIVVMGGMIFFFGDKLPVPGKLPGDIRIERDGFTFMFPVTSMILLSIILTILLHLFRYFK